VKENDREHGHGAQTVNVGPIDRVTDAATAIGLGACLHETVLGHRGVEADHQSRRRVNFEGQG